MLGNRGIQILRAGHKGRAEGKAETIAQCSSHCPDQKGHDPISSGNLKHQPHQLTVKASLTHADTEFRKFLIYIRWEGAGGLCSPLEYSLTYEVSVNDNSFPRHSCCSVIDLLHIVNFSCDPIIGFIMLRWRNCSQGVPSAQSIALCALDLPEESSKLARTAACVCITGFWGRASSDNQPSKRYQDHLRFLWMQVYKRKIINSWFAGHCGPLQVCRYFGHAAHSSSCGVPQPAILYQGVL